MSFGFIILVVNGEKSMPPHNDFYTCDFEVTWGYSIHPEVQLRGQETQQFAFSFYRESIQDVIATLVKK